MACYLPMVCKKAYGDHFSVIALSQKTLVWILTSIREWEKKTVELPDDGSGFVRSFSKMAGWKKMGVSSLWFSGVTAVLQTTIVRKTRGDDPWIRILTWWVNFSSLSLQIWPSEPLGYKSFRWGFSWLTSVFVCGCVWLNHWGLMFCCPPAVE